jgi:predicted RNA binding protein YcfA (HicA-like mRNA interferase family)
VSPRLRRLSGRDIVAILSHFGFEAISQRGSHVKLQRQVQSKEKQTLTVPDHREVDVGTIRAIYRQATRYISEDELYPHFYTD